MAELLTTTQKARRINLDAPIYGTFAEIGAGQEVEVTLLTINHATRRITASIQHVADVPPEEIEQYAVEEEIGGIVAPAKALAEARPAD